VPLEETIKARLARQEILDKTDPPSTQFVLSESCVRHVWGNAIVMRTEVQ
jgi:hypothetical protein